MTWLNALSAWQWLVLLSIPPLVVLLYFLKLRRQPVEVASTYLWRRAIEDLHVNSLWQRLRKNLLLLLQLLFLVALILACLRPTLYGDRESGRRWILLIDQSASMQAQDVKPSRLAEAKNLARQQVEAMNRGDVAMVIAFSDRANIQQGFTEDKQRLVRAIDAIEGTQRTTDIQEAMRAAAGLANPGRVSFGGINDIQVAEGLPATVFIYSDGGFPSLGAFDRGNLVMDYRPIGSSSIRNVSIEAFSVNENDELPGELEVYARLANHGADVEKTTASLYQDEALIDARELSIDPGKEKGLRFELSGSDTGSARYRLELDAADHLAVDNRAYAALRPSRPMEVLLLTPGNSMLQRALNTPSLQSVARVDIDKPDVYVSEGANDHLAKLEEYDLVIFDQCSPPVMPSTNTFFIGGKPPGEAWSLGELGGPIQLLDVERAHPITSFLEVGSIRIVEGRSITPPEGGTVLIRGDTGPIMAIAPRGPFQDAVLGFPLLQSGTGEAVINTDWGIKHSFPVFVFSAVEYLAGGITQSTATSVRPGQPVSILLSSRQSIFEVVKPDRSRAEVERTESGQIVWTDTDLVGTYEVAGQKDSLLDRFSVNLFSSEESKLGVRPEIDVGEERVAAAKVAVPSKQEYFRWFLLLGLILLVGEWFVYNRRVLG